MNKVIFYISLFCIIGILGYHIYNTQSAKNLLVNQFEETQAKLATVSRENAAIREDIVYLSEPENLEKELRARFHYHLPGEKMMIIVPAKMTQ